MFRRFHHRAGHYLLLIALVAGLYLPNLGAPSLWDIDEGNNAEAAREMLERGNWGVPTFNFQTRVDKPALLYWLQITAYRVFGINEFAARLPSALAALAAVLLAYELGRLLFTPAAALLGGVILASTAMFAASAHFANPDALLSACTILTLLIFWSGFRREGRGWFIPAGVSAGLGVLAKGPVGLVLPGAVILLFLLWSRRLRLLLDRRLALGVLAFAVTALPWYVWVGAETKGEFLRGFFWVHNVSRYCAPMEGHGGPPYYYLLTLILGFVPWSVFLGLTLWYAVQESRTQDRGLRIDPDDSARPDPRSSVRFLWCWIAVYLVFFSLSSTKLPNYILPVYAPMALLTARFLDRWQRGFVSPPAWVVHASLAFLGLVGIATSLGLLMAAGVIDVAALRSRSLPGLAVHAWPGLLPVLGAAAAWGCAARRQRRGAVVSIALTAVLFVGTLAGGASVAVDADKAPRPLAQAFESQQTEREVRVGCYQYFRPSLVFYCRREVSQLADEQQVLEFLRYPIPVYLFTPASVWQRLEARVPGPHRVLGRHRDLYLGCDVVVVGNH